MNGTTIIYSGFKGGIGKSTSTSMVAYQLANLGFKTLVIDFDPQSNITKLFMKTRVAEQRVRKIETYKKYIKGKEFRNEWSNIGESKFQLYINFLKNRYPNDIITDTNININDLTVSDFDYSTDTFTIDGIKYEAYSKRFNLNEFIALDCILDYNEDRLILDFNSSLNLVPEGTPKINVDNLLNIPATLMSGIASGSIANLELEIVENLYLIPNHSDFIPFPVFLEDKFKYYNERTKLFKELFDEIKYDYDFVFLDVPPTIGVFTDSALIAADYTVMVLQPHEDSLDGAKSFVDYVRELVNNQGVNLDIVGIQPILVQSDSAIDQEVLEDASNYFGVENMFENIIHYRDRVNRFKRYGITNKDAHDKRVHDMFKNVTKELLNRLEIPIPAKS